MKLGTSENLIQFGKILLLSGLVIVTMVASLRPPTTEEITAERFEITLIFKKHQFEISTSEAGAVREMVMKVSRNNQLLITIRQKTDGWVINAETADLDQNNAPEIYIYSCTYGSGAFGKVYGYQFFPDSFDKIHMAPLTPELSKGYMGHDMFKMEDDHLVRQFPIYLAGDINAKATGGVRKVKYKLQDIEKRLVLIPE